MLYWLLYQKLYPFFHPFRIFRYLTFRTAFASLTALLIALFIGPYVIQKLREFQIGQYIREDGPKSHQKKSGTPTMGGVLIAIAILLPTILWSDPANPFVWIAVFATLAFGAVGFADDYIKVVKRRNLGLTSRQKLLGQAIAAVVVAGVLSILQQFKLFSTQLMVPFVKSWRPDLMWQLPLHWPHWGFLAFIPFVAFVVFVLMGSSNAVNLTDGLDGLAIGCTIIASGALAVLTYVSGHVVFADYLELRHMPQVGELTVFCAAMIGAGMGFLWYNCHPAQVFMGDTGSLALGGALGIVAVLIHQPFVLVIAGGVFVLEAVSVILQRGWFRYTRRRTGTGQRMFLMAPIHHHFEKKGWYESQVVMRFYILCVLFAVVALSTLKIR